MTEPTQNTAPNQEPAPERTQRSELLANILVLVVLGVAATVWWDFFRKPVLFVVTLGILVAIHEWGHFIASKASGVHVYEFALGFGPKLITYMRRGGTDYTIRALPLGGFVNPKGMQPEDPITPDGLNGRRPAERALVYLAGPMMNIIFGVGLFSLLGFLVGTQDESIAYVGGVNKGSEAAKMQVVSFNGAPATGRPAGLQIGDRILTVNGKEVGYNTVTEEIHPNANKLIRMKVQRGKDTLELEGTPRKGESSLKSFVTVTEVPASLKGVLEKGDQLDSVDGKLVYKAKSEQEALEQARRFLAEKKDQQVSLTVWRGDTFLRINAIAVDVPLDLRAGKRSVGQLGFAPITGQGPRASLNESVNTGLNMVGNYFAQMGALFTKPKQLGESVGGPVAIFNIMGPLDKLPPIYYFNILGSLSLSLAVFNLLPVPMLDGGHMLILSVEVLRRRRLEPETQRTVAMVGLALIGVLFVYIMWKDIVKHIL